jgi:hypothetical protein
VTILPLSSPVQLATSTLTLPFRTVGKINAATTKAAAE